MLLDAAFLGLLGEMVEEGMVRTEHHPRLPLRIYAYTHRAAFARRWNAATLVARGLILDDDDRLVARGWPKFFGYDEHFAVHRCYPQGAFEIQEKLDGSLGIAFAHAGEVVVTTKGAFASPQAQWAGRWLGDHLAERGMPDGGFAPGSTYLFEIVYAANRIVVDYGPDADGLVLLDVIDNETAQTDHAEFQRVRDELGFRTPRVYRHTQPLEMLYQAVEANAEGFVVKFFNGVRIKVKGEEYARLHRIVTGVNSRYVWQSLRAGDDLLALLDGIPDELYAWVEATVGFLRAAFAAAMSEVRERHDAVASLASRKEQALAIAGFAYKAAVFCLLDGRVREAEDLVWRTLEPTQDDAPFRRHVDTDA